MPVAPVPSSPSRAVASRPAAGADRDLGAGDAGLSPAFALRKVRAVATSAPTPAPARAVRRRDMRRCFNPCPPTGGRPVRSWGPRGPEGRLTGVPSSERPSARTRSTSRRAHTASTVRDRSRPGRAGTRSGPTACRVPHPEARSSPVRITTLALPRRSVRLRAVDGPPGVRFRPPAPPLVPYGRGRPPRSAQKRAPARRVPGGGSSCRWLRPRQRCVWGVRMERTGQ